MKKAFTLAEVLVTIGIIGVVAAITLPILIKEYKKSVIENRLKQAYTIILNGFKLAEAYNGPIKDWNFDNTDNKFFNTYIEPYFKGAKICQDTNECGYKNFNTLEWSNSYWAVITSSSRILFKLPNNMVVFWGFKKSDQDNDSIFVDINGPKKPNKFGYDVFLFNMDNLKVIIPKVYAETIMKNNWKIPDDYPIKF